MGEGLQPLPRLLPAFPFNMANIDIVHTSITEARNRTIIDSYIVKEVLLWLIKLFEGLR